jgi:hypothetical protein
MRMLFLVMISGALALTWAVPTTSVMAREPVLDSPGSLNRIDSSSELAFTLEEMNCFSSDIHALEPADTYAPESDEMLDTRVAASSGTNGIPCDPRDPKAPPKKKRSRS